MTVENKKNHNETFEKLLSDMDFDIRKVTWGYQDIFFNIIKKLFDDKVITSPQNTTTKTFFSILNHADKSTFDSVIKSYLEALNSSGRWIIRTPQLFEKWSSTGIMLAEKRYFLGMKFFDTTRTGKLGKTPKDLEFVLSMVHFLTEVSVDMADAFITGFSKMQEYLDHDQIRTFVNDALNIFERSSETARKYLAVELESAQKKIESLTTHVRVRENTERLERFLRGILGRDISVDNLSQLDSDDIIERGSSFVTFYKAMYLPELFSVKDSYKKNMQEVKAMLSIGAACDIAESFSCMHGSVGFKTCAVIFREKNNEIYTALFYLIEMKRCIDLAKNKFTGIEQDIEQLIEDHFIFFPPRYFTDILICHLLGVKTDTKRYADIEQLCFFINSASNSCNSWQDTLKYIDQHKEESLNIINDTGAEGLNIPMPLTFFPDYMFPLSVMAQPDGKTYSDLRDQEQNNPENNQEDQNKDDKQDDSKNSDLNNSEEKQDEKKNKDKQNVAGYFYDEWDNKAGDYYPKWCCVHEVQPHIVNKDVNISKELTCYAERVRTIFEQIKPSEIREESRLLEGDEIHLDHFMEYISQGPEKQNTDMRFYNKPLIQKRDMAISVLLDFSGSTGNTIEQHKTKSSASSESHSEKVSFQNSPGLKKDKTVLEIEKEAAFVLASGLNSLGDKFSICGFTGNGRENCLFFRIKDIEEEWSEKTLQRLLNITPGSSTRIGAALRHAGWKLDQVPAKTKLLILITDGQPRDQGYDSSNLYAQYDVKKAAQENMQKNIHTFCISAGENSPADMEIMFPNGRYQILDNIVKLPQTLSQLYLKITK